MKVLVLPLLLAVATLSTAAQAAPKAKAKPTFEQCSDLAAQRGFRPQERGGGNKRFIAACMKGQVQ